MQTFICSLIIIAALLYTANRWMPLKLKQRFMQMLGKTPVVNQSTGGCSSCSSCGNCGSNSTKLAKK
ncbi:hypothetical protein [Solimicrobium silvestre]|uniref:FeoB-associated Cys-rich membrane protein n=1 Tax=Solimicrobium silvestre TaxID=2099400 RepID=A0A2S9GST0_9BURK|nr:hypothetical protein [Solimicrobium silvestre]PRC90770.1 hypothetical protein S2091_4518 [Solimicrobium silvestre]